MYPLKHSLGTVLSPSLSSVYSYFTYMIGLTKRSHVAPKMQLYLFCDSIVRFDWCRTKGIDSVCGVTWIPLCAKDGPVIAWGRGEGETLSIHVVSTQCAEGLTRHEQFKKETQCMWMETLDDVNRSNLNSTSYFWCHSLSWGYFLTQQRQFFILPELSFTFAVNFFSHCTERKNCSTLCMWPNFWFKIWMNHRKMNQRIKKWISMCEVCFDWTIKNDFYVYEQFSFIKSTLELDLRNICWDLWSTGETM